MRILLFSMLLGLCTLACAQQPVSDRDSGLEALMNKVEGNSKSAPSKSIVNNFKAEDGKAFQQGASDMVEKYYKAILDDDLITAYGLMSKTYRKAVSLQNYLKKDRLALQEVLISKIKFEGETCAKVSGTTKGVAGNRIGAVAIPVRLRIFVEDGQWVIFSNPYQQMGFTLPNADKVKFPCNI